MQIYSVQIFPNLPRDFSFNLEISTWILFNFQDQKVFLILS